MLPNRRQQEHEFLPAALEVQETPPSPIGRTITWVIMLFFVTTTGWAIWGEVDIVVVSQGRIIASGHTKVIQPLEIGIVRRIYVQEGQMVKQGDTLIELEPDNAMADGQRIDDELMTLAQEIIRLKMLVNWVDTIAVGKEIAAKEPSPIELSGLQKQLIVSQWNEFRSRIATLRHEKKKHRSERNSINQQVKKYQAILPIIKSRAAKMKKLKQNSFVSEEQYLEVEQQRLEMLHDLKASQQRTEELQAAMQEVDSQIEQVKKEFKSRTLIDLQESQKRQKVLGQEKIHKCRYFCESLFWASQPNQAAKITRQLMPPAAPIRPRHLVSTQQGVETLAPNDFTVFRDALQVFYVSLRKPARRYTYRRLKIFTSLSLRFQDFQRKQLLTCRHKYSKRLFLALFSSWLFIPKEVL